MFIWAGIRLPGKIRNGNVRSDRLSPRQSTESIFAAEPTSVQSVESVLPVVLLLAAEQHQLDGVFHGDVLPDSQQHPHLIDHHSLHIADEIRNGHGSSQHSADSVVPPPAQRLPLRRAGRYPR